MDQKMDTVIDNTVNLGDYNENCLQPMIARTKHILISHDTFEFID